MLASHRAPSPPPPLATRSAVGAALARSLRLLTPSLSRSAFGRLPPNRRGEMRRRVRLACRVRRMDDWRLLGDRTLDLSPAGMLVLSDERVEEGLDLVVSFQATELPIWFDACAKITRVVEGRRPGDPGSASKRTPSARPGSPGRRSRASSSAGISGASRPLSRSVTHRSTWRG